MIMYISKRYKGTIESRERKAQQITSSTPGFINYINEQVIKPTLIYKYEERKQNGEIDEIRIEFEDASEKMEFTEGESVKDILVKEILSKEDAKGKGQRTLTKMMKKNIEVTEGMEV